MYKESLSTTVTEYYNWLFHYRNELATLFLELYVHIMIAIIKNDMKPNSKLYIIVLSWYCTVPIDYSHIAGT